MTNMITYIAEFKGHYRAGSAGYYNGRKRGHVAVYHDSQLWLYKVTFYSKQGKRDFKHWLLSVFDKGYDGYKITGQFPTYYID